MNGGENVQIAGAGTRSEHALIEAALDALVRATGGRLEAHATGARNADAQITLDHRGHAYTFLCEVKANVRSNTVPAVAARLEWVHRETAQPVLLITRYAASKVADALVDRGIQFIDAAGNCHVEHGQLYLAVRGKRLPRRPALEDDARSWTKWTRGALPIVHRLLNDPHAVEWAYRDLATRSGVSVGTVHNVFEDLRRRGFLKRIGTRSRLVDRTRLFEQWVDSYPQYLRPRLVRKRFAIPGAPALQELAQRCLAPLGEQGWALSGEGAAWLMQGYLRPQTLTYYGSGDLDALRETLGARPAADGPVEILSPFWTEPTSPGGSAGLADAMLVYADLVRIDDPRAREAAGRFRDECIQLDAPAR